MIKTELYEKVLFETIKRGATEISADVKEALLTPTFTAVSNMFRYQTLKFKRDNYVCR